MGLSPYWGVLVAIAHLWPEFLGDDSSSLLSALCVRRSCFDCRYFLVACTLRAADSCSMLRLPSTSVFFVLVPWSIREPATVLRARVGSGGHARPKSECCIRALYGTSVPDETSVTEVAPAPMDGTAVIAALLRHTRYCMHRSMRQEFFVVALPPIPLLLAFGPPLSCCGVG